MKTMVTKNKLRLQVYGFDETSKVKLKNHVKNQGYNSVSEFVGEILLNALQSGVLDDNKPTIESDAGRLRFEVRLSSDDGLAFLEQVKALGYNSPARYAKSILLNHMKKTKVSPISVEQRHVLHESNAKLERIGRNINQIARQYNTDPFLAKDSLTIEKLGILTQLLENHCDKVAEVLIENQQVFER